MGPTNSDPIGLFVAGPPSLAGGIECVLHAPAASGAQSAQLARVYGEESGRSRKESTVQLGGWVPGMQHKGRNSFAINKNRLRDYSAR